MTDSGTKCGAQVCCCSNIGNKGFNVAVLPNGLILNPLMPNGSSTSILWAGPFPTEGELNEFYFYHVLLKYLHLMQTV